MTNTRIYAGARIVKRTGKDRLGRAVSGYYIYKYGEYTSVYRSTLREAKIFADSKVVA
jgi:hypothetical protein